MKLALSWLRERLVARAVEHAKKGVAEFLCFLSHQAKIAIGNDVVLRAGFEKILGRET